MFITNHWRGIRISLPQTNIDLWWAETFVCKIQDLEYFTCSIIKALGKDLLVTVDEKKTADSSIMQRGRDT